MTWNYWPWLPKLYISRICREVVKSMHNEIINLTKDAMLNWASKTYIEKWFMDPQFASPIGIWHQKIKESDSYMHPQFASPQFLNKNIFEAPRHVNLHHLKRLLSFITKEKHHRQPQQTKFLRPWKGLNRWSWGQKACRKVKRTRKHAYRTFTS